MSGGSFRGVSASQDGRFDDKTKKLLKSTKFPEHFASRVDMAKVRMEAMMPWIQGEVAKYLGFEDEVVIGYIESQLQETTVDPKKMQIALTGFLEKHTAAFMRDLWLLFQVHQIPLSIADVRADHLAAAALATADPRALTLCERVRQVRLPLVSLLQAEPLQAEPVWVAALQLAAMLYAPARFSQVQADSAATAPQAAVVPQTDPPHLGAEPSWYWAEPEPSKVHCRPAGT